MIKSQYSNRSTIKKDKLNIRSIKMVGVNQKEIRLYKSKVKNIKKLKEPVYFVL